MPTVFQKELRTLAYRLADLCALAASTVEQAARAMLEADQELAGAVLEQAAAVVASGSACEEQACALLTKHVPQTGERQTVMVAVHVATDLAHMGGLCREVAGHVRENSGLFVPLEARPVFTRLGRFAATCAYELQKIIPEPRSARYGELNGAVDQLETDLQDIRARVGGPEWRDGTQAGVELVMLAGLFCRFGLLAMAAARRIDHLLSGEAATGVIR